ncbi:MAG: protein BatD [Sedimentisphaerales bacterium]|nr:protein BatD [Sedimentisphaerales bacterium]
MSRKTGNMNTGVKIFTLLLSVLPFGVVQGAVRIIAQVDTSKDIYVNENFAYYILIDGDNKAGEVDLSPLAKYHPQSAGNRDVSQTSISIINGRTTKTATKQYVMSYSLNVDHPGLIRLPPVTVTLDGKDYQTNPVDITILQPGTTDQLDLEVTLSEQRCYVGQPIIMTVNFYISANIGDFQYNIPIFDGDDFYIEDADVSDQPFKEYNLGNGAIARIAQSRTTHRGKDSILLSFSKVLIPKQSGDKVIPPACVSADVVVGYDRTRDPFDVFGSAKKYKRFMVGSEPLKLTILPLPEANKPSGFYGLVGQYSISASAQPTEVNVGDPITLTIKIGGSKYLNPIQWPNLEQISELANNFKIPSEKATPAIEDGYKVFTQTIRAANDNVAYIPSIPLAYFDADKGEYVVAKTDPIKLKVSPTKVLTSADVEGGSTARLNKEVEAIKKGLSANYESFDALVDHTFSPLVVVITPGYAAIWAAPSFLLLVSVIVRLITHKTPGKTALRRKRSAAGRSVRLLKQISSAKSELRPEQLASAMKQYLGRRFDKTAGSLTSNDCFEIIIHATENKDLAQCFRDIIAECEAARYALKTNDINETKVSEVVKLIRDIDKKSKM